MSTPQPDAATAQAHADEQAGRSRSSRFGVLARRWYGL